MIPLSILIALGTLASQEEEFLFISYFGLLGCYSLLGNSGDLLSKDSNWKSYTFLGTLGMVAILVGLSFFEIWEDLFRKDFAFSSVLWSPEFLSALLLTILGGFLIFKKIRAENIQAVEPLHFMVLVFPILFFLGQFSPTLVVVLINILILLIGILTIRNGANLNHLGLLNFGLILITTLIFCRFLDTDMSFVARGILFVLIGISFFMANIWMLKKRKKNAA